MNIVRNHTEYADAEVKRRKRGRYVEVECDRAALRAVRRMAR